MAASDTPATTVKKVTYTFVYGEGERSDVSTYAFTHKLGTRDVIVSLRSADGGAQRGTLKSVSQDEDIVLVTKADGYPFQNGDTIIVLG